MNTNSRKEAAERLGVSRDTLWLRTAKICRRVGIRPIGKILTQVTFEELQAMSELNRTLERSKARRESLHMWEWTYAAMTPAERAELARQIRKDAAEIAARLGCANRLLPLLA